MHIATRGESVGYEDTETLGGGGYVKSAGYVKLDNPGELGDIADEIKLGEAARHGDSREYADESGEFAR